jgi:3-phenylpropionate/cinnamic acid dioxygenase small subunit
MKTLFSAFALVVLTAVSTPAVQAGDSDVMRQAKDRMEIEDLMWRYVRALDTLNAEAYAAIYAEDGAFATTKGRPALQKMVADIKQGQADRVAKGEKVPPMFHMIANSKIEFVDKDHARVHAYWQTAFGAVGQEVPARVGAVGRSVDDLVRVNGRWLIKQRNVAPTD